MIDAELVARFAAGEPGSVAEIYREYGRLVYTVSYRVLRDPGLAQAATGRTFLEVWRHAASFDPGDDIERWLTTIAGGTAIEMSRRDREQSHEGNVDPAAAAEPELGRPPPPGQRTHDGWLARRAIDSLPDQDRELIRLQHDLGLAPTEIAARLGIPVGSVKSRSYLAHHRLFGLLGQLSVVDPAPQ